MLEKDAQMQKESYVLDSQWQFKEFPPSARRMRDLDSGDWLDATVPSSIFTCLIRNGIVSEQELISTPEQFACVSEKNWVFRKEFDVPPGLLDKDRIEIIFEGLDTVAHIWLNEKLIGKTENMFIEHRFDIKPYLKQSGNTLCVKLVSPLEHTNRLLHRYGKLGDCHLRDPRSVYLRKAAYQFGSEFGPALVGCGIVGNVRIEASTVATIENLHLRTVDCNQHDADIRVALQVNRINQNIHPLICKISLNGGGLEMEQDIVLESINSTASTLLHIERPFLWWPRGYGVPHVYHIKAELLTSDGQLLDCVRHDFGVRTIRIETSPEKTALWVNDRPIHIKGADWMPLSLFPGSESSADYEQLLKTTKDCHINLLRVWAGGTYEAGAFYEWCDRLGILVWQDFMFDSAYYPDRQWFTDSVKEEAKSIIKQLRNHACIALWCGNNNIDSLHKSGKLGKGKKFYGKPIFHDLLPKLVRKLDPDREYIPTHAAHNTENKTPAANTPNIPSPPCQTTLQELKHFKESLGMLQQLSHCPSALEKIARCEIAEFWPPKDLSEYIWQNQIVQARQAKNAVERFRAVESLGCMLGAFKDFALTLSPSMLDVQQCHKALYYYARRFFAAILVTVLPKEQSGNLKAFVVNDSASPVTGMLSCRMMDAQGRILDTVEKPVRVSPFSKTTPVNLPKSFTRPDDPSRSFLHICINNNDTLLAENTLFYGPDKQYKWPMVDVDIEITPDRENNIWNVTLTSETLIRDLQITPPQPADLSDNFLTLLPNEPKTIRITFKNTAPSPQTPIRFYSVNQSLHTNL
jgi:beta-mannosidase